MNINDPAPVGGSHLPPSLTGTATGRSSSPVQQSSQRYCTLCIEEIPHARLAAMPGATQCVRCVEAAGDVVKVKRLDEYVGKEGEDVVETYYIGSNPYIDFVQTRVPGTLSGMHLQAGH